MKRFHVHLHVSDLAASLAFYKKLFAAEPARVEADYAKWMLTDPPVNFAISTRGTQPGLDHLGIQVDNADDLTALKAQAQAADMALLDEGETTCCYARSDKYWVTDPQGVAWEQFHTLGNIPTFNAANTEAKLASAQVCCAPTAMDNDNQTAACCAPAVVATASAGGCCAPAQPAALAAGGCCGPRNAPDAVAAPTPPATASGGCCTPNSKQGCC